MGSGQTTKCGGGVALHPEGVDRNNMAKIDISKIDVALRPEGVDRNTDGKLTPEVVSASPSTRRARVERKS